MVFVCTQLPGCVFGHVLKINKASTRDFKTRGRKKRPSGGIAAGTPEEPRRSVFEEFSRSILKALVGDDYRKCIKLQVRCEIEHLVFISDVPSELDEDKCRDLICDFLDADEALKSKSKSKSICYFLIALHFFKKAEKVEIALTVRAKVDGLSRHHFEIMIGATITASDKRLMATQLCWKYLLTLLTSFFVVKIQAKWQEAELKYGHNSWFQLQRRLWKNAISIPTLFKLLQLYGSEEMEWFEICTGAILYRCISEYKMIPGCTKLIVPDCYQFIMTHGHIVQFFYYCHDEWPCSLLDVFRKILKQS